MALSKHEVKRSTVLIAGGGETIKSSIAMDNISHIITRLTELYNKPVDAAIREVISNATDAVNELPAEERRPVELISPNSFSNNFVVTDHGVGMSVDDVKKIYANYGVSTKKDNLQAVGAYGLGGKAPLAYADHFQVVTTKNGITTNFTMRKIAGEVEVEIHSVERTLESSGTKITIPVEPGDIYLFNSAIRYYEKHSWGSPITIDGTTYFENEDYVHFGDYVIYEDQEQTISGRVHVRRRGLAKYFNSLKNNEFSVDTIHYSLGGWLYAASGSSESSLNPNYVVEIIPALVDFASSRDSITSNEKLNRLNERVIEQLKSGAEIEKAFEIFRDFDEAELHSFDGSLDSSSIKLVNSKIQLEVPRYSARSTFVGELSLMDNKLGINPFQVRDTKDPLSILFGIAWSKNALKRISFSSSYSSLFGNTHSVVDQPKIGDLTKDFPTRVAEVSLSDLALTFFKEESKIVIVTAVNELQLKSFIRNRSALFNSERSEYIYFFSKFSKSKLAKSGRENIEKFLGAKLSWVTADELSASIAVDKKNILLNRRMNRSLAEDKLLKELVQFKIPSKIDDWGSLKQIEAAEEYRVTLERYSFANLIEDESAAIIISRNWKTVYRGASNADEDILGKKIYILYESKLSQSLAVALQDISERVFFGSDFSPKSAAAKKLVEGRVFGGSTFTAIRRRASDKEITVSLLSPHFDGISTPALKVIHEQAPESSRELKHVIATYLEHKAAKEPVKFNQRDALLEAELRGFEIHNHAAQVVKTLKEISDGYSVEAQLHKQIFFPGYSLHNQKSLDPMGPVLEFMFASVTERLVAAMAPQSAV